eukprot:2519466-Rhodomonas_salina.1
MLLPGLACRRTTAEVCSYACAATYRYARSIIWVQPEKAAMLTCKGIGVRVQELTCKGLWVRVHEFVRDAKTRRGASDIVRELLRRRSPRADDDDGGDGDGDDDDDDGDDDDD